MDKEKGQNHDLIILKNVFYGKRVVQYTFTRIHRFSNAIYIVSELLKDDEPIKWSLRKQVLHLVSFIESIRDMSVYSQKAIRTLILIKYSLDLAKSGKVISEMNHGILNKEIESIISLLDNEVANMDNLDGLLFNIERPELPKNTQNTRSSNHKGHVLYNKMSLRNESGHEVKKTNIGRDKDRTFRRNEILKIIQSKPELTIKDISSVIKDCSEKTIQRELIQMLKDNIIKKAGERRWSRYSVV